VQTFSVTYRDDSRRLTASVVNKATSNRLAAACTRLVTFTALPRGPYFSRRRVPAFPTWTTPA
jgi:hypothetical protein